MKQEFGALRLFFDAAAITGYLPEPVAQKFSSEWRRGLGDLKTLVSLLAMKGIIDHIGNEYGNFVQEGEVNFYPLHLARNTEEGDILYKNQAPKDNRILNGMARLATVCSLLAVAGEGLQMISHYKKIGPMGPKQFAHVANIAWLAKSTLAVGFFLISAISGKDIVSRLGKESKVTHLLQNFGFMLSYGTSVYKNAGLHNTEMMQAFRTSNVAQTVFAFVSQSEKLQRFLPSSSQAYSAIKVAAYVSHLIISVKHVNRANLNIFSVPYAYNRNPTPYARVVDNELFDYKKGTNSAPIGKITRSEGIASFRVELNESPKTSYASQSVIQDRSIEEESPIDEEEISSSRKNSVSSTSSTSSEEMSGRVSDVESDAGVNASNTSDTDWD